MAIKKNHIFIVLIFYYSWSLWAIVSLSGCNQTSKNNLTAIDLKAGSVTLLWNDIPGATSYNIYVSELPGVTKFSGSKFPNVTNPIKINQLEPGKTYYFVVTVVNRSGESKESKEVSYTAVADKIGLIYWKDLFDKSLQDHKSDAVETKAVRITWPEVPGAHSYNIYWSDSPGVTKHNGEKISNVKSPYVIKGLKRGSTYYFVITAVNPFGESEESEELELTVD